MPLALFGAVGYGARIAALFMPMQAIASLVLAVVAEQASDRAVLAVVESLALIAFGCPCALRRPRS